MPSPIAAAEWDVEFVPLDEGPNLLMRDPVVQAAIDGGYRGARGKITAVRTERRIKPLMADVLRDVGVVAQESGADLVVHSPAVPARHAAEMLGVPSVLVALQPGWVPTSLFPCPMLPFSWVPRPLNRATYTALSVTLRAYAGSPTVGAPTNWGCHPAGEATTSCATPGSCCRRSARW